MNTVAHDSLVKDICQLRDIIDGLGPLSAVQRGNLAVFCGGIVREHFDRQPQATFREKETLAELVSVILADLLVEAPEISTE